MYSMRRTLHPSDSSADGDGSCGDAGSECSTSSPQADANHTKITGDRRRGRSGNDNKSAEFDSVDYASVLDQGNSQSNSRGVVAGEAPRTPTRRMISNVASSRLNPTGGRIFDSPLLHGPPTPSRSASDAGLVSLEGRWQAMAQLAGDHSQDPRLLDLTNRALPPEALKFGVPPKVAAVVEDFRYDGIIAGKHNLPSFLDLVADLFPKLLRLNLKGGKDRRHSANMNTAPGERKYIEDGIDPALQRKLDATTAAAEKETVRMRRLYILYRLPKLEVIDDLPVSVEERNLARPSPRAGYRVRKDDWLTMAMGSSKDVGSREGERSSHPAAPSSPQTSRGTSPSDGRDDVGSNTGSAVEVSFCGLINYVRSPKRPDVALRRASGGKSGPLHNRSEQRPSRISTDLPLQNDLVNLEPAGVIGGDQVTQGIDNVGASSTTMEQEITCDEDIRRSGHKESSEKHGVMDSPDLDETVGKRITIRPVNKVPFRGSRPPPSPASNFRKLPGLKERRGNRASSRKLWQQRKAATSMLDQEDCTGGDDSNESDLDEPVGKDSGTKEILSSFLVGVE